MPKGRKGNSPCLDSLPLPSPAELDSGKRTPVFCLHYIHPDFHLDQCGREARASFAMALAKRARLTWDELAKSGRHQLGWEYITVEQLRMKLPPKFADNTKVMVLRYHKLHPMVGVRVGHTFHVLAIEANFGDLYDHG